MVVFLISLVVKIRSQTLQQAAGQFHNMKKP